MSLITRLLPRRRVPVVLQMEMSECGAAALAMILGYHGYEATLAEIRLACGTSRDGTNAYHIIKAAEIYGLEALGVSVDLAGLRYMPLPAILHWGFGHFVILEKFSNRAAGIVDPSGGRTRVKRQSFNLKFTGIVLLFQPSNGFCRRPMPQPSRGNYYRVLRRSVSALIQILWASAIVQVLSL